MNGHIFEQRRLTSFQQHLISRSLFTNVIDAMKLFVRNTIANKKFHCVDHISEKGTRNKVLFEGVVMLMDMFNNLIRTKN